MTAASRAYQDISDICDDNDTLSHDIPGVEYEVRQQASQERAFEQLVDSALDS